jgi:hypothetical protein
MFRERIVETEKQPLPGNGFVTRNSGVIVGSGVFCAVRVLASNFYNSGDMSQ